MTFLLDNYDSFTYNLFQYISELGEKVVVRRNDAFELDEIDKLKADRIVISPGPGIPSRAGLTKRVIRNFAGKMPILGVCLGHQAIGEEFGGRVILAERLMHGKTSEIFHDGKGIFKGLSCPFTATRYHSLVVDKKSLPDCLEVSAYTDEGVIMGLRHRSFLVDGVQFHPESILTAEGKKLLENFMSFKGGIRK